MRLPILWLASVFFLAAVTLIGAEEPKPLLPTQLCVIKNRDLFQSVLAQISGEAVEKINLDFPPEIDPNDWWNLAWVTDGNEQWPVVSLALDSKKLAEIDNPDIYFAALDFMTRLIAEESVLRFIFPKGGVTQVRGNRLFVFSYDFPGARIDELDLEKPWGELQRQYDIAWLSESVETRYYKELPPEKPDEGTFLRNARERKANMAKENGAASERFLLGFHVDEIITQQLRVDWKETTMPGSHDARYRQFLDEHDDSFQVGGFYGDKSPVSGALRWYPLNETHSHQYLLLKFGVGFLPLEERQNTDRAMHFIFSYQYTTRKEIEALSDSFDISWSGNMALASPLSAPDDRHEAYSINGAELNDLNWRTLGPFRHWMENLRQASLTWDKEKPFDIACQMEDDVIYLGMAFPPGGEDPDWSPLKDVEKAVNELFRKTLKTSDENDDTEPLMQFHYDVEPVEAAGETGFTFGTLALDLMGDQANVRYLYAQNGNLHCFAIPCAPLYFLTTVFGEEAKTLEEESGDEFVKKYRPILQRKIETSRRLQSEKMKVPSTLARFSIQDKEFLVEAATKGREQRYSLYAEKDSLWILGIFSSFFEDTIHDIRDALSP